MAEEALGAERWNDRLDHLFRAPLKRFFLKRTRSEAEADDLVQDVFTRLLERPDAHKVERPEAYVFTVAVNMLRDRARRDATSRRNGATALAVDAASVDHIAAEAPGSERVLISRNDLDRLIMAMDELAERTRSIFILCRIEGMAHRDVANQFGITVSAVEKQVAKALLHLASRLDR